MNKEAYEFGFQDELEKIARKERRPTFGGRAAEWGVRAAGTYAGMGASLPLYATPLMKKYVKLVERFALKKGAYGPYGPLLSLFGAFAPALLIGNITGRLAVKAGRRLVPIKKQEAEKIARKVEVPESGWKKRTGSRFWHRGTEIAEHRPVRQVSRTRLRRGRRNLSEIAKK